MAKSECLKKVKWNNMFIETLFLDMRFNAYDVSNDWQTCNTTQLADATKYYQKWQIDRMLEDIVISGGGVTSGQVQELIDESTSATTAQVNTIAEQVRQNTADILNTYTKQETNNLLSQYLTKLEAISMRDNYAKIENSTLILNSENIN